MIKQTKKSERKKAEEFLKRLRKLFENDNDVIFYKPGDTFGGHRKPADLIMAFWGMLVLIEFKEEGGKWSEIQKQTFRDFHWAGVIVASVVFRKDGGFFICACRRLRKVTYYGGTWKFATRSDVTHAFYPIDTAENFEDWTERIFDTTF